MPALVAVNARLRSTAFGTSQVVVWRTYMPPRQLITPIVACASEHSAALIDAAGGQHSAAPAIFDLAGAPVAKLQRALSAQPKSLLVAPSWAIAGVGLDPCLRLHRLSRHGPHLDLDNLDELFKHGWRSATVGVWDVDARSCERF